MTRQEKLEEIARLAAACREAQRAYYSRRDRVARVEAKARERSLDDAIAWLPETGGPS